MEFPSIPWHLLHWQLPVSSHFGYERHSLNVAWLYDCDYMAYEWNGGLYHKMFVHALIHPRLRWVHSEFTLREMCASVFTRTYILNLFKITRITFLGHTQSCKQTIMGDVVILLCSRVTWIKLSYNFTNDSICISPYNVAGITPFDDRQRWQEDMYVTWSGPV